jgi:anti-sigma regulatory factor (Ser/Thr protein kinase)
VSAVRTAAQGDLDRIAVLTVRREHDPDPMSGAELHLVVPARSDNVAVVRQAVAGLGEAVGMDGGRIADLKTVVTEACTNVVLHAYEEESGPLEVLASPSEDHLDVTVRDRGAGFRPRPTPHKEASLGLGVPLIAALSDRFEIRGGGERGTEVHMRLSLADRNGAKTEEPAAPPVETAMDIAAGELVRPVLARVLGALGARANFSLDRLADTVLLSDAVSAHAPADFDADRVGVTIADGDGSLDIRIGPLLEGAGERIIAGMDIPGPMGMSLRNLADEVSVMTDTAGPDDAEYLLIKVSS